MVSAAIAQLNFGSHGDQQVALRLYVANVRNIFQDDWFIRQDGGGHGRQSSVLGSADANAADQRIASANYKFIHKTLTRLHRVLEVNPNRPAARYRFLHLVQPGHWICTIAVGSAHASRLGNKFHSKLLRCNRPSNITLNILESLYGLTAA